MFRFAILLRFELAAVGRVGSKEPCVCECFLVCPLAGKSVLAEMVNGDTSLNRLLPSSLRTGVIVGREKFCRLEVLELGFADAATP